MIQCPDRPVQNRQDVSNAEVLLELPISGRGLVAQVKLPFQDTIRMVVLMALELAQLFA